jgi:hypothetical protein
MEKIDREIVDWIVAHSDDAALCEQLQQMLVIRRDYMRTGFFIYFEVPATAPLLNTKVRPVCPDIAGPELMQGAGSSLFFKNGRVHYLELYARGGFFPENPVEYRLVPPT